jgi:hypothetical protein
MSDEQIETAYAPSNDDVTEGSPGSTRMAVARRASQRPHSMVVPAKRQSPHSLTVSFDDPSWAELERLAKTTSFGWSKTGTIRRSVRLAAWLMQSLKAGYKVALYKDGEGPRFVELA